MTELTDREIEVRCAKECGMTTVIRRNGSAYVADIFNRAGDCVNSYWYGNVEPDPSKAMERSAPDFLTDGNACDMLLSEADRRGWEWHETSHRDDGERTYFCLFSSGAILRCTYKEGRAKTADHHRARCLAFLAACDAVKGTVSDEL